MTVNLDELAAKVINAIKGYVDKAVVGTVARLDAIEQKMAGIKLPELAEIAKAAAELVPAPKDGADGKSVDIEQVKLMVAAEVAAIPRPVDGKDADPESVIRAAKAAVDALPKPADGKDADPEVIEKMVQEAVAAIPAPQDGKSITVEEVAPMLADLVKAAVADIPAPKDGADADPELIKALVQEAAQSLPKAPTLEEIAPLVESAVKAIPAPKDGADADPAIVADLVRTEVAKAIGELPQPKDGKDADPEVVKALVKAAVDEIPPAKDGESVPVEQVRGMIDEAVAKAMAGIQLPKDGTPGRDAAHLEILPSIDLEKSYPRNTYAKHAGGFWRSFETTVGMRGWECIVDGIASIEITEPAPRKCAVIVRLSSGGESSKEFTVPGVEDKGIFREGDEYLKGDGVTFGGSWFLAQKDAPAGKPGSSEDWRLAAKRGRDGKDAGDDKPRSVEPVRLA